MLPPINLLRYSPKPQNGCCRTLSYPCIHSLAAYRHGTSDTCPMVLDICVMPTTPPIHHVHILNRRPFSALQDTMSMPLAHHHPAPHPPCHSSALHTLSKHNISPGCPAPHKPQRLDCLRSDETNAMQCLALAPTTRIMVSCGRRRGLLTPLRVRQTTRCCVTLLKHWSCTQSVGRQARRWYT